MSLLLWFPTHYQNYGSIQHKGPRNAILLVIYSCNNSVKKQPPNLCDIQQEAFIIAQASAISQAAPLVLAGLTHMSGGQLAISV